MKKALFGLLLLTTFFIGINVKAKYSSYETGDSILINNHPFIVIEDSDSSTEKLKLMDADGIMVSNMEEIMQECIVYDEDDDGPVMEKYSSPLTLDVQCITERANLCTEYSDDCDYLMIPFESRVLEDDEELVYDENSPSNVGYFIKNKLNNYYKNILGYNNVNTRLITADEQISYFIKTDMIAGGRMMSDYGSLANNECFDYHHESPKKSRSSNGEVSLHGGEIDPIFGYYLVNSLKYTGECKKIVLSTSEEGDIYADMYYYPSNLLPLIEVSKKEFAYELTKEKEGDGTLEIEVNNNYKVGDYVVLNNKPYLIISKNNGQVRLFSLFPVSVSNYDEIEEECYGDSYSDNSIESFTCIAEHAKYCSMIDKNCDILYIPFNSNDIINHTYNPNIETNVGHYIKNELTDAIQEEVGNEINIIDVDVLTFDEVIELNENGILPLTFTRLEYNGHFEALQVPTRNLASSTPFIGGSPVDYTTYYYAILDYNNALDELDPYIDDFGEIYPVITMSVDDLPVNAKAGSTVTITTEPEEGYELVELTVTDDDNNKVIYTPSDLVRRGRGTYTFKMTSANAHVYAKFIPIQTYNAKSLSEELTIDEGLNLLSGTAIKYRIRLNTGDTLTGIVYYDEEQNEISVPFEEENGEYTFDMPPMNVFLRAVIQYADPVYNLYGTDVTIPVQKSKEGGTLTFTVNGTKKVDKITYKDEEGNEIYPYYSLNNGTYSVIMPANDVYVEVTYLDEEAAPIADKEDDITTPITRDNIIKSVSFFGIGLFIFMACVVILKKRKPRKKVLIPYDMV